MSARLRVHGWSCFCCLLLACTTAAQAQSAEKPPTAAPLGLPELTRKLAETKDLVEAEALCTRAIQEAEQRSRANPAAFSERLQGCQCRNQLAGVYVRSLRLAEARTVLTANIAALKEVAAAQPKDAAPRIELARCFRLQAEGFAAAELPVEALEGHRQSIDTLRKLLEEQPGHAECRKELIDELLKNAAILMRLARFQEAEAIYRDAVQLARKPTAPSPEQVKQLGLTLNAYALLVREAGRFFEAAEMIREAIGLLKKLESEHSAQPELWCALPVLCRNLAQPLGYMKRTAEERATLRDAARIETKLTRLPPGPWKEEADAYRFMGILQTSNVQGFLEQGTEPGSSPPQAEERAKAHPGVPVYQYELVRLKVTQSVRAMAEGAPDRAHEQLRQAQELAAKLVAQFPDVPKYRQQQASVWSLTAMTHIIGGNAAEGEVLLPKGLAILDKLAADYPKVPRFRYAASEVLMHLTLLHRAQGNLAEAGRFFTAALPLMKKLAEEYPLCPEYRRHYAQGYLTLGNLLLTRGEDAEAEKAIREGIRLWEKTAADFPQSREFRSAHGDAYAHLGHFLSTSGRRAEAEEAFRQTLLVHHRLATDFPREPECHAALAVDYARCGLTCENHQQFADACECYSRAIIALETALRLYPRQREWLGSLQVAYRQRGYMASRIGKQAEYESDLLRAKQVEERLDPSGLRLARVRQRLQEGALPSALQEAEDLYLDDDLDASEWHELAKCYARAVGDAEAARKDTLAVRAVQSLRRAIDGGYTNAVPLAKQEEFQGLAGREDFQRLPSVQPR